MRSLRQVGLGLLLCVVAHGQNAPPVPDLLLHFDVNLVQLDAVVTDRKNRHVATLKADDFEVLQDRKPQKRRCAMRFSRH
ncbi:MAG: hypothetical protein WA324_08690 [Bryobacteraceae bacterium]